MASVALAPAKAVSFIRKHGALLVYPLDNRREPASLWSCFFPRTKMRWEWTDDGDNRVAEMWHLREVLSRSRKVVYAKWYRGRATFFSRELFPALASLVHFHNPHRALMPEAVRILRLLEMNSPLSTKELKRESGLQGRPLEGIYQKALTQLWQRLLIVGFGEVDDGAFPSLAVGATALLHEELWSEADRLSREAAEERIARALPESNLFRNELDRLIKRWRARPRPGSSIALSSL